MLGFPVHVGGGFVLFMVLIAAINGTEYGLWLAGALAVFTLLHELGHAQVARWAGAEAEISLEFMAGFASYRPTRPISRPMEALIRCRARSSTSPPGSLVLLAMGESPLSATGLGRRGGAGGLVGRPRDRGAQPDPGPARSTVATSSRPSSRASSGPGPVG